MRYIISLLLACGEGVGGGVFVFHSTKNLYNNLKLTIQKNLTQTESKFP